MQDCAKFKIEELASFQFMGVNQNLIGHTPQEVEILEMKRSFTKVCLSVHLSAF